MTELYVVSVLLAVIAYAGLVDAQDFGRAIAWFSTGMGWALFLTQEPGALTPRVVWAGAKRLGVIGLALWWFAEPVAAVVAARLAER